MYIKWIKPVLDVTAALMAVLALSPLFLVLIVAIKLDSKGPVFFTQKRVGKGKKYFQIYKFRTMRTDAPKDCPTHLLEDPQMYITRVGKFLRKTSLDELPQFFNLLRLDMSIVGPRPALWNQEDLIALRDENGANDLVPGITGWAQVNGRDELPVAVKAAFDGEYAKRVGFFFDVKCIWMTIGQVASATGVREGKETVHK